MSADREAARWKYDGVRVVPGDRLDSDAPPGDLVIVRDDHLPPAHPSRPGRIDLVETSHPVPDAADQCAAPGIAQLTRGLTAHDLAAPGPTFTKINDFRASSIA